MLRRMVISLVAMAALGGSLFFLVGDYADHFEQQSPEDFKLASAFASVPLGMKLGGVTTMLGEPDEETAELDLEGYEYSGTPHEDAKRLGVERCHYWFDSVGNAYVIGCESSGMTLLKVRAKPADTGPGEDEEP